jgi:hypothetical protein
MPEKCGFETPCPTWFRKKKREKQFMYAMRKANKENVIVSGGIWLS